MSLLLTSTLLSFIDNFFYRGFLIFEVLFGIGLLIFIHEFGHFMAAKFFKVRVEIFSLGFGAPIKIGKYRLSKFYKDTEYRIALIPFGGYVKMAGDWPGEETTGANDEFNSKPVYQRMIIMVAGVVMNAILCLVLFVIAYSIGVQFHAPRIGSVAPGLPAWEAGLKPGDTIVGIDGEPIHTFDEIIPIIAFSEKAIEVKVERPSPEDNSKTVTKTFTVSPAYDEQLGFRAIGVRQSYNRDGKVLEGLAAYEAGLRTEDQIISINGEPAKSNGEILKYTQDSIEPKPIEILVKRPSENNAEKIIKIHPKMTSYIIGVIMSQKYIKAVRGDVAKYLKEEDELVTVDGKKIHVFSNLQEYAQTLDKTQQPNVLFEVLRGKEKKLTKIELPTELLQGEDFYQDLASHMNTTVLGEVLEDKPAYKAGLRIGDKIIKINEEPIDSFNTMSSLISTSEGKALEVVYLRDGKEQKTQITPQTRYLFELGIQVGPQLLEKPLRCDNLIDAIGLGLKQTKQMAQHVMLMLISLFTREVHPSNLGGPVTIFQASYNFAQFGFGRMVHWLALISINLAVINILPIPVLDGGHLMFLFFEKLKGSPINPQTMLIFQYIGLVFILILMVYVTFNDISRLFDFIG